MLVGAPLVPCALAFLSAQIWEGVFPPSSAKVLLALPTCAAAAGAGFKTGSLGRGGFVPAKVGAGATLFEIFGFGRLVKRPEKLGAVEA